MSAWSLFAAVAVAHLLAVMSPGPDFAMVTRQTLAFGRPAGVWTALGIGSGITFHVAWAMFGMGWVIDRFPLFLELLRYAAVAFLLYVGVRALRTQPAPAGADGAGVADPGGPAHHFAIGVLTNLLNPKALMFFMAVCAAVITETTPVWLRIALGGWMIFSTAAWFCFVAFTLGHPAVRRRLLGQAHWIDRGMGAVLVLLALIMLFSALR